MIGSCGENDSIFKDLNHLIAGMLGFDELKTPDENWYTIFLKPSLSN